MTKTCCMFNYAPHYRNLIYSKIDKELKYDLCFGDKVPVNIRRIDVATYTNYQKDLKNIFFKNLYWQRGAIRNVFKSYKNFIMTGDLSGVSTWIVMILARLSGKKVYLWSHGWYERDGKVKSLFRKLFFSLSHKVLLYGDYAKQIMMKHGFKDEDLIVIYNSLDYDTQKKVRDKLTYTDVFIDKFGNNYPTLCYVGRIQQWKRLDLLIDAMVQLKNENFPLNLVIIGKDDEHSGLEGYINENSLSDNVWLYGPSYNEEEIGELIFNSDICVSPGNVGLTAIHSLMYGTPVITHSDFGYQNPEVEAITNNVTGSFFERNDSKDLALKIRDWLKRNSKNDSALKEKCYKIIDEKYNPYYQVEILRKVIGEG
ncbi:MAG: glycosyltransferase [Dysgonamonadaceae bacterium]|nr:glycosyltransferase [Dysgonamonadaceae bacterium]